MKQKQQTKNKHSGSSRARSDQWTMDMQNRLKNTLEAKKSDSTGKNVEELRNNYYAIPNVKDAELTAVDEDLHLLEVRLDSLEVRIDTILNSSKKSSSGQVMKTNDNFEIKTKIPPLVLPEFSGKYEEFSSFEIQFDDLITNNILLSESQKLYYLRSCLTHEVNYLCKGLGIRDDPVLHERDQAIENYKETVEFEKGRYIVQHPFRKSYNELSDNYPIAKQRFHNLWRRFGHDSGNYIINTVKSFAITQNRAVRKDGRLTSKTRIVFDAGSHQNNELSLNDCLWPGIYLNPNLLDVLINFRLNAIAFCSDIKQAFLRICLADEHKYAVRFLWSDDELCVHKRPKLQVYRFNRVNFGVSSSPFLLAATIRHHIAKYKHEFPHTVELLDRYFYVDDLISGGNEFEEALQTSRRAKNIMEAAGMDLRKWITNDADLMEQRKKENFNVHPVHETVSLGANGTKVPGLRWNTNEDYLTTDTKSLLEFISLDKNTKRFILQAVGKIFDPLGLISPSTVRMKCLFQDLWKDEIQWDDPTLVSRTGTFCWVKMLQNVPRVKSHIQSIIF
ncbi:integrase catalytic domain-containing protein [Trichonephila clavipes]|nr:integrase catalytic domain-containing protein [Trichonephila clavipes]